MSVDRSSLVERIVAERGRHFNLPGSEWDLRNTPNDWVAIATHYLGETVRRGGNLPEADAFTDGLVKAAAVILAALEQTDRMTAAGHLLPPSADADKDPD